MPKSRLKSGVTPRPGLHDSNLSPPSRERGSPYAQNRVNAAQSPECHMLKDEISSDEDTLNATDGIDDVARTSPRKAPLYPIISEDEITMYNESSPNQDPFLKSFCDSTNDSFGTSRSQCYSRTSSKPLPKELPVTPEKESPVKNLYPEDLSKHKRNASLRFLKIIFILCLLAGLGALLLYSNKTEQDQNPKVHTKSIKEVYEDIKKQLKYINKLFSQPRYLWIQLLSQIESIMVDNPNQPAVILVVVPEDARGTATCLIHRIAEAIKYAFEDSRFVMYDGKSDAASHHRTLKEELDNVLQGLMKAHAAVIHNIEKIPGEAATIFHAYCDNENAPFKQAVLFPIIEVHGHYDELVEKRLDTTVDDLLMEIWGSDLPAKDVSAVVSRIANAAVLVKPESRWKVQELCPI